ncbi:MAG: DNA-directed RNA polymerase subunit omega [Clostridia bacterium]|nr:DNA-directed RNA polymerase subunit omega [Clostridia bacterium]
MINPSPEQLLEKADNRYELVIAVAKRARQIAETEEFKSNSEENSEVSLAAEELVEDKYSVIK